MADEVLTPQEEQVKWLTEASNSIKRNAFFMKRALDEDNLREALRYSAALLGELRTSLLTPQKYFELYMQAFDELRHLEVSFAEEHKKGRSYADLYELVQHAGNVLPRLYLLCTVGACYIRSKEAHARDILKDLVEMCKGVQHPTRGLFLRSYLCQVARGLLPDVGSEYEGEGGNINDAVEFLLINFTEMNKLWVRMQHQGSQRDRERREKERQQLADLVGKNLTYVSQLDGLDYNLYKDLVLPRVMEQIISCKDDIAQQYLMQCVIQGFPDDFHLGTLDTLLKAIPELQAGVKLHVILSSLMDRLSRYAGTAGSVVEDFDKVEAFAKLNASAGKVSEAHPEMAVADVTAIYIALLSFTAKVYPQRMDYVDLILESCCEALHARGVRGSDPRGEKQLLLLLSIPLETYDVVTVLSLVYYPKVMAQLAPPTHKEMAVKIVQAILKNNTKLTSVDKVEMLFDFVAPLVKDMPGAPPEDENDYFDEEQNLVARLQHQFQAETSEEQYGILLAARKRFNEGGAARQRHTLPPLAFSALKTIPGVRKAEAAGSNVEATCSKVLQFVHGVCAYLAEVEMAEMALQLFLSAAYYASEVAHLEEISYELFEQAFILYEEAIPDSKAEITALQSIVGCLQRCHIFGQENRDTLVHKATGYSAKLLKKPDQCRAVCACSHLFWQTPLPSAKSEPVGEEGADGEEPAAVQNGGGDQAAAAGPAPPQIRDGDSVMVCLKRALKIANSAQQQQLVASSKHTSVNPVELFVEILNQYLYYYDQELPNITASVLQSLLELVSNEMAAANGKEDLALKAFYKNTVNHAVWQKKQDGTIGALYSKLQISA